MNSDELGLPLEYRALPQFFDAHEISKDTEVKNQVIEQILQKYDVKSVLDLTCGTGSQVFFLEKQDINALELILVLHF